MKMLVFNYVINEISENSMIYYKKIFEVKHCKAGRYDIISSNITSDMDIADYISTEFYKLL
jgi:hypothetical protein